ncbi:hypothetical protein RSSM_00416 [Rhodopirellula sallentina SM41]|uniref:Uncharacterized protein n=1 Tax=Rhodopirellula sallentina SM41 TaxID=1263870 RepID=M5UJV1_9BACT|nr:hypothetical protein RSSM_00416 [Rhodopirellula sallentina SM41]
MFYDGIGKVTGDRIGGDDGKESLLYEPPVPCGGRFGICNWKDP